MLSNLKDETATSTVLNFKSVQDSGKGVLLELNINDGTNDGTDFWSGKFMLLWKVMSRNSSTYRISPVDLASVA